MIARAALAMAALASTACAPQLLRLPSGPGAPASDIREVLAAATARCRSIESITAEARVSGSVGGRRLRARLELGLQAPASARLTAVGPFARALFILAARGDEATLVLNQDNRVLEKGRPAAVLEALTGVPLDAAGLRDALTACPPAAVAESSARQLGEDWRSIGGDASIAYLRREEAGEPWQLVAVVYRPKDGPEWRAEYRDFTNGLPRTIHFVSADRERFDLRLALADVEVNQPIPVEAFSVRIPASAAPITLDELRDAGPLGDREQ
jgi:outer membrane biogenesis lipoprotein LolB